MEWYRDWQLQVNKIEIRKNYKNMNQEYWTYGQVRDVYINKFSEEQKCTAKTEWNCGVWVFLDFEIKTQK